MGQWARRGGRRPREGFREADSSPAQRRACPASEDLVVVGVVEVKSYFPSARVVGEQLRRHVDRLRLDVGSPKRAHDSLHCRLRVVSGFGHCAHAPAGDYESPAFEFVRRRKCSVSCRLRGLCVVGGTRWRPSWSPIQIHTGWWSLLVDRKGVALFRSIQRLRIGGVVARAEGRAHSQEDLKGHFHAMSEGKSQRIAVVG